MKSLTKLWFDYKALDCDKNKCIITHRLFFQKLENEKFDEDSIYLLVNTLSGAIDLFDKSEGKFIESAINTQKFDNFPNYLFEYLIKRGYIFKSKEIEELVFDTFINDYKKRNYPKGKILGYFTLDTSCPMGCEYCFEKQSFDQNNIFEKSVMDEKSINAAIQFLNLICSIQGRQVDFVAGWGGEPLQEKNFEINKLFIKFAKNNNFPIAYFSNLAFIGDKTTELLAKNADNIKFLQTTIDGLYNNHNSNRKLSNAFEITVKNIDKLLKLDLPVIVRTNIGENNVNFLPEIAKFYDQKGWFNFPKFKGYITHTYDRHHEFTKNFTLKENIALSKYLKFRDEFPFVRKIQGIKFAPALKNIINAFKIRESLDITSDDFMIKTLPLISYCFTSNRCEYVFTGGPDYSVYNCAECTGIRSFKIGCYYPDFRILKNNARAWGIKNSIHEIRSIDNLKTCKKCRAATHCGGYCALEAINNSDNSCDVYCKKADQIISDFLKNESSRLYDRAKLFINNTYNITL